ncbi:hypothetical protein SAMN05661008_00353 [Alkalithermobacter thermoalcaliphilus JW-YL-7 = DSM 7308]|uniref:Uncharacterized protein n=2 Tax=Clostridium paradoxum TaxID=29346 RepID=A0A150FQY0_CLOPD|nr:hypothetical protein JWYL7_0535 [[Clostridium] paradoxum JW-YL-7 = DSM 7308]SHK50813.1 hypothetical protein SAMN05661008_00353 [[Clostridium] paradoxum JW-YL-7 = DSM 7308]
MYTKEDKQELVYSILEGLDMVGDVYAKEIIEEALEVYTIIKQTTIQYCQSCGKAFTKEELVYYALIDNNIVCQNCSTVHYQKYLRIVK